MSIAEPLPHAPIVVESTVPHRERQATLTSWIARSRGWISIVLLTPVAIGAAFSPLWCGPDSWGYFWIDCLGWSLFICGGAMRWWATLYIGGRKSVELISDGPYSISRNPIYCGTFLLTVAVGVLAQSVAFLFAVILVAMAYVVLTTTIEEEKLLTCYGNSFRMYRSRVPRFAPNLRSLPLAEYDRGADEGPAGRIPPDVQVGVDSRPLQSRDSPAIRSMVAGLVLASLVRRVWGRRWIGGRWRRAEKRLDGGMAALVGTGHVDRRLVLECAFLDASAATETAIGIDHRLAHDLGALPPAVMDLDLHVHQPDGLGRDGAGFDAGPAVSAVGIRDAPRMIDGGDSQADLVLLLRRKPCDGAGGTDLAAQRTVIFASPDARRHPGRP